MNMKIVFLLPFVTSTHALRTGSDSLEDAFAVSLDVDRFKRYVSQSNLSTRNNGREALIVMFSNGWFKKFITQEINGMLETDVWFETLDAMSMEAPDRSATAGVRTRSPSMFYGGDRLAIELTGMNLAYCTRAAVTVRLRVIDNELFLDNIIILPEEGGLWRNAQYYTGMTVAQQLVNGAILRALKLSRFKDPKLFGKKCFCSVDGTPEFNVYVASMMEDSGHFGLALAFSSLAARAGAIDYVVDVPFSQLSAAAGRAEIGFFISNGLWDAFWGSAFKEKAKKVLTGRFSKTFSGWNIAWLLNLGLKLAFLADEPDLQNVVERYTTDVSVNALDLTRDHLRGAFRITGFMINFDVTNGGTSVVSAIWGEDETERFSYSYTYQEEGQVFELPGSQAGFGPISFGENGHDALSEARDFCNSHPQCEAIVQECDPERADPPERQHLIPRTDVCAFVPRTFPMVRKGSYVPHGASYPTKAHDYSGRMRITEVFTKALRFESCIYMKCPDGYQKRPDAGKNWCRGPRCDKDSAYDANECCWPESSVRVFMGPNHNGEATVCSDTYYSIWRNLPAEFDTIEDWDMNPDRPLAGCEIDPGQYEPEDLATYRRLFHVYYEEYWLFPELLATAPKQRLMAQVCVQARDRVMPVPAPEDGRRDRDSGLYVRCVKTYTRPNQHGPDQCRSHMRMHGGQC